MIFGVLMVEELDAGQSDDLDTEQSVDQDSTMKVLPLVKNYSVSE